MTKLGQVFPGADLGADVSGIRDYVQAAEDLGYSHLIAYDHVDLLQEYANALK